ncbi:hypothetical protein CCUS01_07559 [Colletotrichum cuscutae]|uniref:Uncharacterized protein n=1 Tax=Colletotrichum cuscutae TaxID=1209917 RepID=A0AAI9XYG3_9PEZI|nr:hypothetical protein CCUS01_07559 [Colletotrichum cuscutae]
MFPFASRVSCQLATCPGIRFLAGLGPTIWFVPGNTWHMSDLECLGLAAIRPLLSCKWSKQAESWC